jgi:hypothetical protein
MAPKNNFGNVPIPQNFFTQLLIGAFLTIILQLTTKNTAWSIFLGILGGFSIGWFSETNKTGPDTSPVATSEGIDAGLKYWLFFLAGFVWLRYPPTLGIFLGALGGFGGGTILAWWESKEATQTDLPPELTEGEIAELPKQVTGRQKRQTRRFRRPRGGRINFRFWE